MAQFPALSTDRDQICIPGLAGLSPFILNRLRKKIAEVAPGINILSCQSLYLVQAQVAPDDTQSQQLLRVLGLPSELEINQGPGALVAPRLGTISPWASLAQDVLHHCQCQWVNRVEHALWYSFSAEPSARALDVLHDPMTESVFSHWDQAGQIFTRETPRKLQEIDALGEGEQALRDYAKVQGLGLSEDEISYLHRAYMQYGRNPTDAELMMFAQVNSEHCRHKIFNATWSLDGRKLNHSLFDMIRNTHSCNPQGVLSAYSDNAAVLEGSDASVFAINPESGEYGFTQAQSHIVAKVETHNHPTAIAPFPGAATGAGGEIRDEGATGRGARPKAGMCGFTVSDLHLPEAGRPWEDDRARPDWIASPLRIMQEGPLGSARYNNEFGRPNLGGYFRTFESASDDFRWGYDKPIMLAGGLGNIRTEHIHKQPCEEGSRLIVLGGAAMLIGLGGGGASSVTAGEQSSDLDFASVQRDNAEVQRRCQEVIERCRALGADNPIQLIHDVGAGGLSNALPELIADGGAGGRLQLRDILSAEPGLSPMEIWCNEAQERYVLAVKERDLSRFIALCERENCPWAEVGVATQQPHLNLWDQHFDNAPVDVPLELLFGSPPQMHREISSDSALQVGGDARQALQGLSLQDCLQRVLLLPSVASKQFLITIGDRSVGGTTVRDQMVGPWQTPVADCAVTCADYQGVAGEGMAMGERSALATLDSVAAARMALAEVVSNMAGLGLQDTSDIKVSANWMAAAGATDQDRALYAAVEAVGMQMAPELGIAIPVGKDSLSMQVRWNKGDDEQRVVSPVSLIATGFAAVPDVRVALSPLLQPVQSELLLIDLGDGEQRLGGSALAQVYAKEAPSGWGAPPDVKDSAALRKAFAMLGEFTRSGKLLAIHDRSDGGLWTCLAEMAFTNRCGLDINLSCTADQVIPALFNEEMGWVVQVAQPHIEKVIEQFHQAGLGAHPIAAVRDDQQLRISGDGELLAELSRAEAQQIWDDTSYQVQRLRDNPDTAEQEHREIQHTDTALVARPSFEPSVPAVSKVRPKLAVLREQGVNGHLEMAAAFDLAGFTAVDVHMRDLLAGQHDLTDFKMLAVCGGFSYGDVLGGGSGWARSILENPKLYDMFAAYFADPDSLTLGVCNGCQMLSQLSDIIPGTAGWPRFVENISGRLEARFSQVEILPSPSLLLQGMQGSLLPITLAHGEGRVQFTDERQPLEVCMRFATADAQPASDYPQNPNGSEDGITGVTSEDGRVTITMPHPERAFRTLQWSWAPEDWRNNPQSPWHEHSPWLQMFRNATKLLS